MPRWVFVPVLAGVLATLAFAVPPDAANEKSKATSPEAEESAKRAQVAKGLKVEVWASEPNLANPVSFAFDEKGRCFVVETYRHTDGVTDTRSHMYWLDDDLACRSVEDRLAMYKKHKFPAYEKFGEQLRMVWDSTGSGKADKNSVFAGPFNKPEDGVAAGVLARKGEVFFACIPSLYKLKDTKGENKADVVEKLSTGYGIHVQFIGHDLHGLRMGPDGKLYMSIGDRGFKVVTKEGKTLNNPDSGAVLRCDPDGKNLEVVHIGLRNPQELAFDDFGNLFTFDNNSDSGDKARWVQIVEGGDSGWRCGYQYGTLMHHNGVPQGNRGPWNTEKIWEVPSATAMPPAYVVPPLMHIGNGPSGMTHYPGVGLNARYKDHFFATDFTASPGNSVIWSLSVKPKGASFEVTDLHPFVKDMVPTDCEFGPDGAFYWLDWTGGWNKPNKGRIFKVTDPEAMVNPVVAESQKLIADGMTKKTNGELVALFDHPHQQVRLEAQYELVKRQGASQELEKYKPKSDLGTIHKLWAWSAIGQAKSAADYFAHETAVVRWNAVKVYAKRRRLANEIVENNTLVVTKLLTDSDARVRAEAAISYGKLVRNRQDGLFAEVHQSACVPLFKLLKDNNNQDAYLRQAAVEGLIAAVGGSSPCELASAWKISKDQFDTPAVRLGVVLALRKMQCNKLDEWLTDSDPQVVVEAARAIYDQELLTPMAGLAKLADTANLPEAVAYRAAAANYKLGGPENAIRLANVAARSSEPDHLRSAALKMLGEWSKPSRRDPITGLTQNLPERPQADVVSAVKPVLAKLFVGTELVRKEAASVTAKLGIKEVGPLMAALVADAKQPATLRVEALFALDAVKATELADSAKLALISPEPKLRAAARVVNAKANPTAAFTELPALLRDEKATIIEKQMALEVMGTLKESNDVDESIALQLDAITAGKLPVELKLDAMEAAQARSTTKDLKLHAELREKLKAIDTADRDASVKDPLARYRDSIAGGDAIRGRELFINNTAVYCQRCHKLDGQGGEVGPQLNGIGAKQPRDYLLESIVYPNAKIAEGYQSVILNTVDGKSLAGVLRKKDATGYTIVTADNKVITVPKDDVESEKPDKSAMPDDLHKKLTKRELRDIVEFLTSLKVEPKK